MNRFVIVVTGSQRASGNLVRQAVREGLLRFRGADQVIVIHGDARGIDEMAKEFAAELDFDTLSIPYFSHLGGQGGFTRSQCMVEMARVLIEYGYKGICLAFPDSQSSGTYDCRDYAKKAGFRTITTRI